MQIHEAIYKFENSISEKNCKRLIPYMDKKCSVKAQIINDDKGPKIDTEIRDVYSHFLNPHDYGAKSHFTAVANSIKGSIQKYMKSFPFVRKLHMSDVNMLKYEKGHFFKKHTDANTHLHRMISIIINLNEGYEGGDLLFHNPSTLKPYSKLQLKTGDMVLFPSNFLYPHEITPLTKGVRYSIVAWLS